VVVLDECGIESGQVLERPEIPTLQEEPAVVFEGVGLDEETAS
jgi:hypothetical protein